MKSNILILFLTIFSSVLSSCSSKQVEKKTITETTKQTQPSPVSPGKKMKKGKEFDFVIPFQSSKWHSLKYSSIPANLTHFSSEHISIRVHHSASPLIYAMTDNPLIITGISVQGHVDRLVNIQHSEKQGKDGWDDFNLRLGLVVLGQKRPNWFQRAFAPEWVKVMFNLAPKDQGIDQIYFLNAVLSPRLLQKKRIHPLSQYITEHYVWLMDKSGSFSYSYEFPDPKHTGALWISVDGDDTQSEFHLKIQKIFLTTQL